MIGLFILALSVRLLHITGTDIAGDEPFSIFMAQFPVADIIRFLNTGNNPPLFEVLLHYYMLLVGDSDVSLRLLPTTLSALTVIPIFLIGDRFFHRSMALSASLLFIFSIFNIRFAHEVRVYALFTLVFAWALYFFLSILRNPRLFAGWFGLIIANAILLYAHYLSVYILFAQAITAFLFLPKANWKYLIGAFIITLLIYTPSLFVFFERLGKVSGAGTWVQPPGWGELYGSINLLLNDRVTTVLILAVVVLGWALTQKNPIRQRLNAAMAHHAGLTVLLWFIVPYGLMFFISKFYLPMFIDRYILFTSVPLFLSVAWLVNIAWSDFRFSFVGAVLLVVASVATTDTDPPNNRKIADTAKHIARLKDDRTIVYISPSHFNLAFAYHYNRAWFSLRDKDVPTAALDSAMASHHILCINRKEELQPIDAQRVIFLDAASAFVRPDNGILETLQSSMNLTETHHHHQIFDIYVFERFP